MKQLWYEYVQVSPYRLLYVCLYCLTVSGLFQWVMELETGFIDVDEISFNLCKTRGRGRNLKEQCVIANVPGQHGRNITMCAAISYNGVLRLLPTSLFLILCIISSFPMTRGTDKGSQGLLSSGTMQVPNRLCSVVHNWFNDHLQLLMLNLSPFSPF